MDLKQDFFLEPQSQLLEARMLASQDNPGDERAPIQQTSECE